MILHIVKCESCDAQFSFNHFERPEQRTAPDGWLTLFSAKEMYAQEGWHFCSLTCLWKWTRKRIEEINKPLAQQGLIHEPYPFCCQEHGTISIGNVLENTPL